MPKERSGGGKPPGSTVEVEDIRFINPIADDSEEDDLSPGGTPRSPGVAYVEGSDMLHDHHVAEFECHLSEDDIADLTYAFQACDADRGGTIDVTELCNFTGSLVSACDSWVFFF